MLAAERASRGLPTRFAPVITAAKIPLPRNAGWLRRELGRREGPAATLPAVVINEVCATGLPGFTDEHGNSHDWVEIFNRSQDPVSLEGFTLSDNRLRPGRWAFPRAVLPAGGRYLVWLSGAAGGPGFPGDDRPRWPHAGFRLRRFGETLALYDPRGRLLDFVTTVQTAPGRTFARVPEGEGPFVEADPTPLGRSVLSAAVADRQSGYYPQGTEVALSVESGEGTVRCTLDGTDPTADSPACREPLELRRTTIVKARVFQEGAWPGPPLVRAFWVGQDPPPTLLFLAIDPADLYSPHKGIIANPLATGRAWKRPVWAIFMEGGAVVFEGPARIRVQGNTTRKAPEKSFRLEFGPSPDGGSGGFSFFDGREGGATRNLLLRAAADYSTDEDWREGRYCPNPVADPLVYAMLRACGVPAPRTRYAAVAFNGEIYGVSVLTEEVDAAFLERRYGHSDFDLVQVHTKQPVKLGTGQRLEELRALIHEALSRDMEKGAQLLAERLPSLLDMASLERWLTVISFAAVRDHNQGYYVRDRRREDSRLQQLAYDMDSAFLRRAADAGAPEAWEINKLREFKLDKHDLRARALRVLLEADPDYRQRFAFLFQDLVNHRLSAGVWLPELERLAGEYRQLVGYQQLGDAARGTVHPPDLERRRRFEITVEQVATFLRRRPQRVLELAGEYLLQGAPHRVDLAVDGEGDVLLNGHSARHGFRGWYFPGTPLRFEARARQGWRFLRWESAGRDAGSAELQLSAAADFSVTAVFAAADASGGKR